MSPAASTAIFIAMRIASERDRPGGNVERLEAILADLIWAFPEIEAEIDAWADEEGDECVIRPV